METGVAPAAGKRVRAVAPGFEGERASVGAILTHHIPPLRYFGIPLPIFC